MDAAERTRSSGRCQIAGGARARGQADQSAARTRHHRHAAGRCHRPAAEAGDLAHQAGAIVDRDLDRPAASARLEPQHRPGPSDGRSSPMRAGRQADQGARIGRWRSAVQSLICGIRPDPQEAESRPQSGPRAIMPGDPEVLLTIWGQARVAASLFRDDLGQALARATTGTRRHAGAAARTAPRRAWGSTRCCRRCRAGRAVRHRPGAGGRGCSRLEQGYLRYAEAALEGRDGNRDRAAELAEKGKAGSRSYAPWWNHLARRLVAPAALQDGWGQPVGWLREAAAEFEVSGHSTPGLRLPGHPAQSGRPGTAHLAEARPGCPPRCAGSA